MTPDPGGLTSHPAAAHAGDLPEIPRSRAYPRPAFRRPSSPDGEPDTCPPGGFRFPNGRSRKSVRFGLNRDDSRFTRTPRTGSSYASLLVVRRWGKTSRPEMCGDKFLSHGAHRLADDAGGYRQGCACDGAAETSAGSRVRSLGVSMRERKGWPVGTTLRRQTVRRAWGRKRGRGYLSRRRAPVMRRWQV